MQPSRSLLLLAALLLPAAAGAQQAALSTPPGAGAPSPALLDAFGRYPQLILGPGLRMTDGTGPVPTFCGVAGGVVEAKGQPATLYRGVDPKEPELCNLSAGGQDIQAWFGIWVTSWPGAENGRAALRQAIGGKTGEVVGFDTVMSPTLSYHDLIRNEGVEELPLLGYTYTTLKISHYREGFGGNNYRSVATVWKDYGTGMIVYATYQHISGQPELDDPLDPTAITLPP